MRCEMGLLDNDISGILIRRELGVPAGVPTAALRKNFESFFFWLAWYRPDLSDELVRCTSASELIMTFPCCLELRITPSYWIQLTSLRLPFQIKSQQSAIIRAD
jgi:hypothetical protein